MKGFKEAQWRYDNMNDDHLFNECDGCNEKDQEIEALRDRIEELEAEIEGEREWRESA